MAVSSASQVAARLEKAGGAIRKAQLQAVKNAALVLKNANRAGAPARLRNVGRNGAALGVSFRVTGGANPTAVGRATGPWPIIENNTKPHIIVPKRKRAGGGLRLPDGGIRRSVHHPGTRGKQLFHKSTIAGTPKAVKELHKTTALAVKEALG